MNSKEQKAAIKLAADNLDSIKKSILESGKKQEIQNKQIK